MKRIRWTIIALVGLIAAGALMLLIKTDRNSQAMQPILLPVAFQGEYSLDGRPWQTLTPGSHLPADEGDLRLRGHFNTQEVMSDQLYLYLDHLDVTMKVNGEELFSTFKPTERIAEDFCGKYWYEYPMPDITKDDEIEILLHNPHRFGNSNAYHDFLNGIYHVNVHFGKDFILDKGSAHRTAAMATAILSFIVLGFALAFAFLNMSFGGRLALFGLSSLLMSGYIALDTQDVYYWSERILFNTSASHLCMMLAALGFGFFVSEILRDREQKAALVALGLMSVFDAAVILLSAGRFVRICSAVMPWALMQALVSVVLIVCLIRSHRKLESENEQFIALSCFVLLLLILVDLMCCLLGWPLEGKCSKTGFVVLLMAFLFWTMRIAPQQYRQALRAEHLEGELEESRIAVMVSQIHPHFLFNALSTIRHLCRTQPDQAWEALGDFSAYLRANTDALTSTKLIPFSQELRHIQSYLKLEKLRFGDRLNIVFDLEEEDFLIPPLTVQPLVENAVKHGIFYAKDGGTVCIATSKAGGIVEIVVSDDGVGFDGVEQIKENDRVHVGLKNVQMRLGKLLHAQMSIESKRNEGTKVTIRIG